jgi:hypothetical protein
MEQDITASNVMILISASSVIGTLSEYIALMNCMNLTHWK